MSNAIRIEAPGSLTADDLASSLPDFDVEVVRQGKSFEVVVVPDEATSHRLVQLFDAIGSWLTDNELASCLVHFGPRSYALLQPELGETTDATEFLLERNIQLQGALESRITLAQAAGVLSALLDVDVDHAFELLRRSARDRRRPLREVADEIIQRRAVPAGIADTSEYAT